MRVCSHGSSPALGSTSFGTGVYSTARSRGLLLSGQMKNKMFQLSMHVGVHAMSTQCVCSQAVFSLCTPLISSPIFPAMHVYL